MMFMDDNNVWDEKFGWIIIDGKYGWMENEWKIVENWWKWLMMLVWMTIMDEI
jgi:hypothetical protein